MTLKITFSKLNHSQRTVIGEETTDITVLTLCGIAFWRDEHRDKFITTQKMTEVTSIKAISFLKTIAITVVILGAMGSLAFLLNEGRHSPIFLLVLFVGWVLSPFIGLLVANKIFRNWSLTARVIFNYLMLILPLISVAFYSGTLTSTQTKPAAIFLMVPLMSWLIIVTFILIAKFVIGNVKR